MVSGWNGHTTVTVLISSKKATLQYLYFFKTVSHKMSMLDSTCDPLPVSRVTRITGIEHQTEPQETILKRKEQTSKTPVGFLYKFIGGGCVPFPIMKNNEITLTLLVHSVFLDQIFSLDLYTL